MAKENKNLQFVVFKEGDIWLAQGIQHDICAQASELDELRERLLDTIHAEMHFCGSGTLDHIAPAPAQFQQMRTEKTGFNLKLVLQGASDGQVELALL